MRIKDTDIPQAAIDAGRSAMTDGFKAIEIQSAVSAALRSDETFRYPTSTPRGMDELDMRVADRMIQKARQEGRISFAKGRWKVAA